MSLDLAFILSELPNCEPKAITLDDLSLEKQISFLDAFKSWKDIEKGKKKGNGFANASILNQKRNPSVFTTLEAKSAEIFDSFDLRYVHELRFKGNDSLNKMHHYKLDFFFPESRINIEISPDFHVKYRLVAIRDALKKRILNRDGIRVFHVRTFVRRRNGQIISLPDIAKLRKLAKMIQSSKISPECIEYYM
jgi:very-short-patch-repair endonuclease